MIYPECEQSWALRAFLRSSFHKASSPATPSMGAPSKHPCTVAWEKVLGTSVSHVYPPGELTPCIITRPLTNPWITSLGQPARRHP